jgi:hypothetical protein
MVKQKNKATKAGNTMPREPITAIDVILRSVDETGRRLGWSGKIEHRADSFCKVHVSLNRGSLLGTGIDLIFDAKSEKYVILRFAENHAPYLRAFDQHNAILQECLTFIAALPSEGTRQLNLWTGNAKTNESWRFEWFGKTSQGAWVLAAPKTSDTARQEDNKQDATANNGARAPTPSEQTTWRGNGEPPKTRADKIKALQAWDALKPDERPRLEAWLLENFGSDPATGTLLVPPSTFRGWRKLTSKNSS